MQNLTINTVKALYSNQEFKALVESVKRCRAEAVKMRKIVDEYTLPVFESFYLFDEFTGERIQKMEDAWNASTEDFNEYNQKCIEAAHKAGFSHLGDSCPALIAENATLKSETALVKFACEAFGLPLIRKIELRDRFLSMLMKELVDQ